MRTNKWMPRVSILLYCLHIGLLMTILALSGCGSGDGGAGGSEVPNISVTASASNTTAGGLSVYLAATTNIAGNIDWTLNGPGRLDATAGSAVNYWPPSASDLTEDATASVSANILSASASLDITVTGSSTMQWNHTQIVGANLDKVAYGEGKYVLLDKEGSLYVGDGKNWSQPIKLNIQTPTSVTFGSVTFGNGRFVLVGYTFLSGKVFSSADGTNWQDVTPSQASGIPPLAALVFANGSFTAVGRNGCTLVSIDGISWTDVTVPGAGAEPRYDNTWAGSNTFVTLSGANGKLFVGGVMIPPLTHGLGLPGPPWRVNVFSSPDAGRTWTYITPDYSKSCYPGGLLVVGGTQIVAAGYCNGSTLVSSSDGVNWSPPTSVGKQAQPLMSCVDTITGQLNNNFSSFAYGGGRFAAIACGHLLSSVNGTDWGIADGTVRDSASLKLQNVIYTGDHFVAVGGPDILISI